MKPTLPSRRVLSLLNSLALDLVYLLLLPFLLALLLVVSRGLTRPKYRRGLLQKLAGFPARSGARPAFWIHAVSVGEVLIAEPFVKALAEGYPEWDVVISVSTFTGRDVARRRFPERAVFYFPFDLTPAVALALGRLRPTVVILLELEVWPNFLLCARRRGVPVLVANGRLTERSLARYRRLGCIGRQVFRQVAAFAVQNERYADRFRRLGVAERRISVLGNMKYDRRPSPEAMNSDETRAILGWGRDTGAVILAAGCTHPGEEAQLISMFLRLKDVEPRLRMILAPRHVERLVPGEIESWGSPLPLRRRSELPQGGEGSGAGDYILLIDTVGELERFYGAADLVVVGGSFVPHGGHNLLEPTRLGKPTVFGPHHDNFKEEAEYLLRHDAAILAADETELEANLVELLRSPGGRRDLGERARAAVERLGGAVERHVEWLERHLQLFLRDGC